MSARIRLNDAELALLEDTLHRAVRLSETCALLTHPSNPQHDAYTDSQARLGALLARVRKAGHA